MLGRPLVHSVPRGRYDSPISRVAEFLASVGLDFIFSNAVAGLRVLLLRIHGAVRINAALALVLAPILPVSVAPILIEARCVHVPVRLPLCHAGLQPFLLEVARVLLSDAFVRTLSRAQQINSRYRKRQRARICVLENAACIASHDLRARFLPRSRERRYVRAQARRKLLLDVQSYGRPKFKWIQHRLGTCACDLWSVQFGVGLAQCAGAD